jgi:hypothetical protein
VNDALLVRGLECLGNLFRNRERFVEGQALAGRKGPPYVGGVVGPAARWWGALAARL